MSPTLDTLGWHTRSVQDAAIALSLLSNWQGLQEFERGFTGELRFLTTPAVRRAEVACAAVVVTYGFIVELAGRLG